MDVFICYCRGDKDVVEALVRVIESAGRSVWLDEALTGGQDWWNKILNEIEQCSVFVRAISNDADRSDPCRRESDYAAKLGIPVIPVQVGPFDRAFEYREQLVDYNRHSSESGARVAAALAECESRTRDNMTVALPARPQIPFADLMEIGLKVDDPDIRRRDQEILIGQLSAKLRRDESARGPARALLEKLRQHPECTYDNALTIDELLTVFPRLGPEQHKVRDNDSAAHLPHGWSMIRSGATRLMWEIRRLLRTLTRRIVALSALVAMILVAIVLVHVLSVPASVSPVDRQTANIRVLNSGTRTGLAEAVARDLRCSGWKVAAFDNYSQPGVLTSTVFYRDDFEERLARNLAYNYGLQVAVRPPAMSSQTPGLIVVVTNDYKGVSACH